MLWSKAFIQTLKESPQDAEIASHKLMLRASLVRKLAAGVYSYLPLGLKVLKKIEEIIRLEMDSCGAQEVLLPALQPAELWRQSGRLNQLGKDMVSFTDRHGREMVLGPTHEEVITELAKDYVKSYRQLPLILYQIQTKFRDEVRPRFGVIRSREFIMKDAYSFDIDRDGLDKSYSIVFDAYCRIFKKCGLNFVIVEADPGIMGGDVSHEFMVPAESGEDIILYCQSCGWQVTGKDREDSCPALSAKECMIEVRKGGTCPRCGKKMELKTTIEVGHVFKLGTKYSQALGAIYSDEQGTQRPIVMGCYGIGVSRIIAAIIEQNYDKNGIIWPVSVAPYKVLILPVNVADRRSMELANQLHRDLLKESIDVLLDERDEHAGMKFKDAELIGIPFRITIGEENLKKSNVEIKTRCSGEVIVVEKEEVVRRIKKLIRREEDEPCYTL
jgi:prolyl-tRNA synthetase